MAITTYYPESGNLYFTIGEDGTEHVVDENGNVEFEIRTYDGTQYFRCHIEELKELFLEFNARQCAINMCRKMIPQ